MEEKTMKISLNKAREIYKDGNNSIRKLLLGTFTKDELEEQPLPKTWEEWVIKNPGISTGEAYVTTNSSIETYKSATNRSQNEYNLLSSREQAEAILTLIKLIRLRDAYRQDWVPNWNDPLQYKYCVTPNFRYADNILTYNCVPVSLLSFPTEELAQKFLNNFKKDIEKLKCLL